MGTCTTEYNFSVNFIHQQISYNYISNDFACIFGSQLHSIFLHVRKVRRMAGVCDAKSTVVKVEWMVNWITFFVARLASHILITYKLVTDAPKFGKGIELPLALFGMAGMNLLNVFLGLDLLKAYRREKNDQLKRQE
eukprot:TRINITY_DN14926_c0_g1_i1.p1 TRINITY_DN14926_c0_g1~~TRINITY_DN14926_c0_g1_i1.p1  ORF type:complete len:137 (-),score=16.21 TRINITY_DN14926_c0_g1_i1:313-723(-)